MIVVGVVRGARCAALLNQGARMNNARRQAAWLFLVGVAYWYLLSGLGVRLVGGLSTPLMGLGWFDLCTTFVLVMTKAQRNYTLSVW